MKITEKAAYIKGLAEGLELDPKDKLTKVVKSLIDLVQEMSETITELEQCYDDVCDQIDALDEDLSGVEDLLYEDKNDDEKLCSCCGSTSDEAAYEVTCPTCQTVIGLTEEDISKDGMICPTCGENLEFDYDEDELDDENSAAADEDKKDTDEE
ncbi:MAG: hypothetical protein II735_06870 [Clostridia bacterium]|nr:hypothetical protein [Clostridia bacterium]